MMESENDKQCQELKQYWGGGGGGGGLLAAIFLLFNFLFYQSLHMFVLWS